MASVRRLPGRRGRACSPFFRRALAQRVVVGEGLSRLNDDPVEGFAEQAQIGIAVFIVAVLRLAGAENIPEINGIPRISGSTNVMGTETVSRAWPAPAPLSPRPDRRNSRRSRGRTGIPSCRGNRQRARCRFHRKWHQVQLRGADSAGMSTVTRYSPRPAGGHGLTVSPQNLVTGAVHVQMRFGNTHGQFQRLAGGAGVVVFRAEVGGAAGEGVVGVAEFCVKLAGIALQRGADIFEFTLR